MQMDEVGKQRKLQLEELEEIRNKSYEGSRFYKEKTKTFHDRMILRKKFFVGKKVLLFHSKLKLFLVNYALAELDLLLLLIFFLMVQLRFGVRPLTKFLRLTAIV